MSGRSTALRAAGVAVAVVAVVAAYLVGRQADSPSFPGEGSVDVGFARDMSIHHAGAVELAELVRDRTDDPAIRRLAADVALTQQAQIGRMRGWLDAWGVPPTRTGPVMGWMGEPVAASEMPGLASRAELDALAASSGTEADLQFLSLLIEHHRAGVVMADAAVAAATEGSVRALARAIASSQAAEIEALSAMLEERGGRVPPPATAEHAGSGHG